MSEPYNVLAQAHDTKRIVEWEELPPENAASAVDDSGQPEAQQNRQQRKAEEGKNPDASCPR